MKKEISNEETRRHVQRAVDLFFNSLPKVEKKENCIEQTDLAEAVAKLGKQAFKDSGEMHEVKLPRPTYKEKPESCTKCELDARGHYMKELKHDCDKEEPKPKCVKKNGYLGCYCGKCEPDDYPLPKDFLKEPKSTLREEAKEIILMDKTYPTASERANKIISLFKDTLIKELPLLKVERWTTTGAPFVSEENIAHNNVIKNIKDIIKNL